MQHDQRALSAQTMKSQSIAILVFEHSFIFIIRKRYIPVMKNNPSNVLLPLATLSLASCASQQKRRTQASEHYLHDDGRPYHTSMSCYGGNLLQTPNMDRIANEGIRMDNCYAVNALSGPSRACVLTGKFSHENGFTDNASTFNGDQQTFPKLLQQAGYQTAMIGKWHLISEPQGFDHWSILSGQHEQGDYYDPDFWEDGKHIVEKGYATDIITDKAIKFLEGRDKNKPFCMMYHQKAPHRNWMPTRATLGIFNNTISPNPPACSTTTRDAAEQPANRTCPSNIP